MNKKIISGLSKLSLNDSQIVKPKLTLVPFSQLDPKSLCHFLRYLDLSDLVNFIKVEENKQLIYDYASADSNNSSKANKDLFNTIFLKPLLYKTFYLETKPVKPLSIEMDPYGVAYSSLLTMGKDYQWESIELRGHTDYVRSVNWSPDGKYILSGSGDRSIRLWEKKDINNKTSK